MIDSERLVRNVDQGRGAIAIGEGERLDRPGIVVPLRRPKRRRGFNTEGVGRGLLDAAHGSDPLAGSDEGSSRRRGRPVDGDDPKAVSGGKVLSRTDRHDVEGIEVIDARPSAQIRLASDEKGPPRRVGMGRGRACPGRRRPVAKDPIDGGRGATCDLRIKRDRLGRGGENGRRLDPQGDSLAPKEQVRAAGGGGDEDDDDHDDDPLPPRRRPRSGRNGRF